MVGTLVNTATVVVGAGLGLVVGERLPERLKSIVLTALGLITMWIGVTMVVNGQKPLLIVISVVGGAVCGELLRLEERIERLAEWLRRRTRSRAPQFVLGFVTASLLFCVGPMTVVGSLEDGLKGDSTLLVTKAIMDGFAALALASSLGAGVLFSFLTVLIVQGGLTLLGAHMQFAMEPGVLQPMTAVGGILILGLALRLLGIKQIPVANFLPALAMIMALAYFF
jgi:uncharacterized membrane protein YqgA involved in biofilm formation